ncbi:hypothetical protein LOC71_22935 [Rhodopirellula sp. JC740]|uniref:Secreted protein n=1 Tax=Rhodopirellula halodulae TaxID=2894198 RepID=A0ABS8NNK1_9BACT|nr:MULTISPECIES: hypothetical protein [unclassified Rhodopirellula]MCC9645145.1 hypothetical protein [Rhodopirellula sp. JC740]MCC9658661.1 hypothetical protein [Rhodopirellula sp. JC737]
MKKYFALLMCGACLSLSLGCDEGPSNVVGSASESDIDEYNRMLQESQAQMAEADEAMAKEMKKKPQR